MSELLRLANELIYSTEHRGYSETYVDIDDAIKVIKGYQELLRRIVFVYDSSENLANLEGLIEEAALSIPQEQSNE